MSIFDDLIPQQKTGGTNLFADLIPTKPTPAPAPTGEPTAAELEAASKPSFATAKPFRKDTALKEVQDAAIEERNRPKFSWQEMTTNQDLQNIQREFLKIRGGVDTTSLSNEDVSKQFMQGMRRDEVNTFSLIGSINALKNANMEDKVKLEMGKQLFDQVKSATEAGGQPGMRPYLDVAQAALTDLTNYIGIGVGAAGRKLLQVGAKKEFGRMLGTEGAEAAAKSRLAQIATPTAGKVTAVTAGTEAVIGAGQDVLAQKEEQTRAAIRGEEPEDIDYTRTAAMSLLSGVFGYGEAKGALAIKPGKTGKEELNTILQSKTIVPKTPNAPQTPAERVLTDKVTENMDTVVEEFMNIQGGRILDDINPATPLTDAKIQKELSARAVRVALHVMETDPTFRVKPGQKTSMAINEVFSNLDKIDDVTLEQAIRKEGLTPEEFAQANKLTVTEAAQVMQQYSAAAKAMQRLTQIDPEFAKRAELLFGKPNETAEGLGVFNRISQLERESKAWIVSGIATTVRNVFGTTSALTFNSAASLVEGIAYTTGRTLKAAIDPRSSAIDTLKKGVGDTIRDAFEVYGYMAKSGLSAETTDLLLQHNPAIRSQILSATQESSTKELSQAARIFNSLNVAQDAFFRRAIFTATVEKDMRAIGADMYETLAKGQTIPADILKNAAETTLKTTFSYTPKMKGIGSFENLAESGGNLFVKAAEFPGGSLFATFPRYMTNAIAFQYRYSPLGGVIPAKDFATNVRKAIDGDEVAIAAVQKANQDIAKSVVGTAALYAAYEYRLANQDIDWNMYKNDDGTTTDMRPLGVQASYLAVADWLVKRKMGVEPDTRGTMEQIVGLKMSGGTQGYLVDQIFNAFSAEKEAERTLADIGRVFGDFANRFVQPFVVKSAYEFFDLFREEGAIARDPNVLKSEGAVDRIIEAATNRVQSKLPVAKEQLPEAVVRLQEGPAYKEGEFFYSLVGVRDVPNKTPEEKEIKRLGIDPYRLYGPSSGDREYDRAFVKEANQYVIEAIRQTMERPDYQNLPANEQRYKLTKIVSKALTVPKEIVAAKMTAEDFDKVQKMRFNKLTLEERKIINNHYAEENNGVTLEEANDYRSIDEYLAKAIEPLKYALGGFVGKIGAKKAAKTATGSVLDLAKKTGKESPVATQISDIVEQELKTTSPAIDQMSAVLQGKPAAAPVKKAPAVKPKQPLAAQTEEAMPSLTPKEEIAPVVKEEPTTTTSGYTDEDYALGEKLMIESSALSEAQLKSWKASDYGGYMSDVHVYTNMAKGVKWKDAPPSPFKSKVSMQDADNIEYDIDGNEISVNGVAVKPEKGADEMLSTDFDDVFAEPSPVVGKGIASGDLETNVNWIDLDDSTMKDQVRYAKERTDVLAQLRKLRTDEFSKIRKDQSFDSFDDEVLAVLQGDFRKKFDREFNVATDKDVGVQMAQKYQQKLDYLRELYKNVPDKKLWHGNTAEKIAPVKKSGFAQPNKKKSYHEELYVGAPSFTSDLNLNMANEGFGGPVGENILYTKIPYADYVFTRINMSPAAYDVRDLNTIAQSINGSPTVVRAVSLPRAGYYEKESMIPEPDKLNKKLKVATEDINKSIDKGITQSEYNQQLKTMSKNIEKTLKSKDVKDAYSTYQSIRDTMNMLNAMTSNISVKGGRGHQQAAKLNSFEDKYRSQFNKIADVLENGGAKQKADALRNFNESLSKYESSYGTTATEETSRIKNLQGVFDAAEKLAKGGFVSKRR